MYKSYKAFFLNAQEKTVAKKRYLAKKARRHKVLSKAKKASAPKNKAWDPSTQPLTDDTSVPVIPAPTKGESGANAEAGPSRIPLSSPQSPPPPAAGDKKRKRKGKDAEDVPPETLLFDEAAERERRKQEKRAKRATRDHDEKKRKKEEKARLRAAPVTADTEEMEKGETSVLVEEGAKHTSSLPQNGDDGVEEESEDEEGSEVEDNVEGENEQPTTNDKVDDKASPPPLMAFPLPTPAAAPDPKLLSRQGLPENLANATLIDQNMRVGLEDMKALYPNGEQGIDEKTITHLKEMGINDFFAGEVPRT